MNTEKSRSLIHKLFIFIAAVGLLVNITFDFVAVKENNESDSVGSRVVSSFQALRHLERLNYLLSTGDFNGQKDSIEKEIAQVSDFRTDTLNAAAIDGLKKAIATSPKQAIKANTVLTSATVEEIAKLQNLDNTLNSQVEGEMRKALILDLVLIALMLVLFFFNVQAKRKVELNLRTTLVSMRESLMSLEEEALNRKVASKIVVHDLKNPIGTIMGFAQLLHDDPKSELTVTEFSDRIRQISERSLVLVESLLSENEAKDRTKSKIDMIPIIQEISSQLDVQAAAKDQKIIRDIRIQSAILLGDSLKLEEVISNVLSNAIKYSPRGAKIKIRASKLNNSVQIEIEDQGSGFSEIDKKNAFQFGKKLSAIPTANESSTGFGLYIVKQIVEDCNGEVSILDSSSGPGAVIKIQLPLLSAEGSTMDISV